MQGNTVDGVHVASTGGVWATLVQGFAGMRDNWGVLSFDPRLPADWEHIGFSLHRQGSRVRVDLTRSELTLTLIEGGPLQVRVVDERVTVSGDSPTVVTLADQGPVIRGRPPRLADIGVVPHGAHDVDGTEPGAPLG